VEGGSLVGQKFKKSAENIGVDSGSHDIFLLICPVWRMSMNQMICYKKKKQNSLPPENYGLFISNLPLMKQVLN